MICKNLSELLLSKDWSQKTLAEIAEEIGSTVNSVRCTMRKLRDNNGVVVVAADYTPRKADDPALLEEKMQRLQQRQNQREMPKAENPCSGCFYWRLIVVTCGSKEKMCHYLLDTGHARKCPPGANCTRRL